MTRIFKTGRPPRANWPWAIASALLAMFSQVQAEPLVTTNLAVFATPQVSSVLSPEMSEWINDGDTAPIAGERGFGVCATDPGSQWAELDWGHAVRTRQIEVWWLTNNFVRVPASCRVLYWDGQQFAPVKNAAGLGLLPGQGNVSTFDEVATSKLRLEFEATPNPNPIPDWMLKQGAGLLEWKVFDAGQTRPFAVRAFAGPDRTVVSPAKTYLRGKAAGQEPSATWSQAFGPGTVTFADKFALATTAQFSQPGRYTLKLTVTDHDATASDTVNVTVTAPMPSQFLAPVATRRYQLTSPLWRERIKAQIVHWIPHCLAQLSQPDLPEGGLENFIQAGNKLAGRPHKPHQGAVFANTCLLNVLESMSLALMVDPQGDEAMAAAQTDIRQKLDEWIPIILAAQEPDGYLQTRFTLGYANEQNTTPPRWTYRGDHEAYIAGYFIEAAIANFWLTDGRDRRLYDAAKKLADCWDAHIGPPPKKLWMEGHEEMELALVRLARLVNEAEGLGRGDKYTRLAHFLLECRRQGETYDQSHLPVAQQYEAVGHAVRAAYCYSGMTDVAMETRNPEYYGAVQSIWGNMVHAKYYVTGGIGSGATAEGFGKDIALPNDSYCESCASCGNLFFQHRLNLASQDARYAAIMEETLYNAILGSMDLAGKNFTYQNPLDQSFDRYPWHPCPCCVGNIPRTLFQLPTWMYARGAESLTVNQYLGSRVAVGSVAGTEVEIEQQTDYPWHGQVELKVLPASPTRFTLRLRLPQRDVSKLYQGAPAADGLEALAVNGKACPLTVEQGYAVITRKWRAGDRVTLTLPLNVQRVKASDLIAADRGRVALRYGPLVYNCESVDQNLEGILRPEAPLTLKWEPALLGGVMAIQGVFADGTPLTAIPNFARNNRGGRSIVWLKDR